MSFSAFSTLFAGAADRLGEIRRLTDLADGDTGIIDDETDCDKAYWENLGPTSTTGTHSAALIDLFRTLNARDDGATVKLGYVDGTNSRITISNTGVGIGTAPSATYDLVVGTDGLDVKGSLVAEGTAALTGAVAFGSSLTMTTGMAFNTGSFDIRISEEVHPATLGQVKQLFYQDSYGNLIFKNRFSGAQAWEVYPTEGIAGEFIIKNNADKEAFIFNTVQDQNVLTIIDGDVSVADITNWSYWVDGCGLNIIGDNYAVISFNSLNTSFCNQQIRFNADPEGANKNWYLSRTYNAGANDYMQFSYEGDPILRISDDLVHVLSGSGYDSRFLVTSTQSETIEFIEMIPNLRGETTRDEGASLVYGGAIRIGWQDTYVGVLRQDSFAAWSSLRLYYDTYSIASADPNVAIGKPLGTYDEPIDCLNVMDTPFLVAVNADHRWLHSNHSTKEGLWIGRGNASSTWKGARIYLQDQSGYRSAIQWGFYEEIFTQFVKDGVSRLTSTTGSNEFGNTVLGFMSMPTMATTNDLTTDMTTIEAEIQSSVSEINPGAMVMIEDVNDRRELWVVTPDGANWARVQMDLSAVAVS